MGTAGLYLLIVLGIAAYAGVVYFTVDFVVTFFFGKRNR